MSAPESRGPAGGRAGADAETALSPVPGAELRAAVLAAAERLDRAGDEAGARELRTALAGWDRDREAWIGDLARRLGLHHDVNNALVGVRGNVQLLLMGPAAQLAGVRERLEVVLRESDRIRDAAVRLHGLKLALSALAHEGRDPQSRRAA